MLKMELRLCILTIREEVCKIQNRKATACPKDRQKRGKDDFVEYQRKCTDEQ